MITKYFYYLTKRNWAWPYHVILATLGQIVVLGFLLSRDIPAPYGWHVILSGLVVMAVGYIYETIQGKKDQQAKKEFWEDMTGNLAGVMLGSLTVYYILSLAKI